MAHFNNTDIRKLYAVNMQQLGNNNMKTFM